MTSSIQRIWDDLGYKEDIYGLEDDEGEDDYLCMSENNNSYSDGSDS